MCHLFSYNRRPWRLLWDQLVPKLSGGANQAPAGNLALGLCVCMVDLSPTRLCPFFTRPEIWSNSKSSSRVCQRPCWPTLPCCAAAALPSVPLCLLKQSWMNQEGAQGVVKTSEMLASVLEMSVTASLPKSAAREGCLSFGLALQ